jgi:RNA polymerase sigma-70 factor (ECF subfamily)
MSRRDPTFDELFRRCFPRALSIACRILGDDAAAEDAAAEALARAYARWGQLQHVDYAEWWVLRVTTNVCLDALRRRRPAPTPVQPRSMEDDLAEVLSLRAALRGLPRRQQEALLLCHLGGMTAEEAGTVLGVSANTVSTHVQRGLATLRGEFVAGAVS